MTILYFILIFGLLVISHEFGHFLVARINGIHVVEFSIGMGPKLLKWGKKDTEYSLRLLPIGGACVFENEDGLKKEEGVPSEHSFPNASVWSRFATVFAGPMFNFILAFLIGIILAGSAGVDLPVLGGVMEGYPAQEAGMQAGDKLIRLNGERIYLSREIDLVTYLNAGKPLEVEYERDGQRYATTLTPKRDEESGAYYYGIQNYRQWVDAKGINVFQYGYFEMRFSWKQTIKSLQMLFSGKVTKDDVAGPIGMVQIIGDVEEAAEPYGFRVLALELMNLAMLLSVNLGVINLLPVPALDGGRLVFLLLEAVRGKPVPPEKEGLIHFVGFVVLMIFMALVMFNDIGRLFR